MDPKFNEAWFNADHVVLGRRLHPFCLNDALILSLLESPFLLGATPGVDYAMTDLQLAVTVCSTPADVFLNARLDSSPWKRLRRFMWTRRCARMGLAPESQKFVTYLDDFYSAPDTWDDGEDGTLRAPWVLSNAVFLLRHTSFSEDRAWTMPIGQALWYAATLSEQLGSKIQLLSEDELAGLEALAKEDAAHAQ